VLVLLMVDEGLTTASYALDEALIDFGSALDDLVSSTPGSNLIVWLFVCLVNLGTFYA
jgi:hypothetical protein